MKSQLLAVAAGLVLSVSCGTADTSTNDTMKVLPIVESPTSEPGIEAGVSACYTGLMGETVIRAGGCNFPIEPMAPRSEKRFYKGIYKLDIYSDTTYATLIGELPEPMAYGAAVTVPSGLVIAGGTSPTAALDTAIIISADSKGELRLTPLPSLPESLDNMACAAIGNTIYLAGGNFGGIPSNVLLSLDTTAPDEGWKILTSFPGNPRVQPVMASSSATGIPLLYLWGGFASKGEEREATLNTDGYVYDPMTDVWSPIESPHTADGETISTGGGTATSLPSGNILITGGVNKEIFLEALRNQAPDYLSHAAEWYRFNDRVLIFNPADKTWHASMPNKATARAGASATLNPSGTKLLITGGELKPRIRTATVTTIPLNESDR